MLLARPADVLRAGGRHLLTSAERRRAEALRSPADRDAHVAAHLLVRHCAAVRAGLPVAALELVQRCAECGSPEHGRPSIAGLPDLHVSLAHTRGAVVAGADSRPVGVDVEEARPGPPDPALLAAALTAAEAAEVRAAADPSAALLRSWVRKECLVKVGALTLDGLSQVALDPAADRAAEDGRRRGRFGPLHLVDWSDPALGAAVAAAGHAPPVVAAPHTWARTP
ncbi:4'-phosphopantetheinyl transferase superfamily protein [Geodermatophilus sp. DSM 44513]|uniref:4'-phosphopantetheinyl transferase family protein n=1 Tax=Geodermatophilus sp. DSM 44513 TaxID=1528104 RepID=UPI001412E7FA|nr:4'-phosphopantetheinyl transferase superfamily protein [Geodermatophilus sp. DSM 44513]WNV76037.1 4'-phosphopantetheinyl transferase superfamily protein [Geodermatophilus sp. DSM 44513]